MATHSTTAAEKIPWTEEPGWLRSTRSQRIRHDRVTINTRCLLQYSRASLVAQVLKNPSAMQETWVCSLGLFPRLGRSLGEGKGYPLQHSGLENSMYCIVHGVAKSQTRLSDFHLHFILCLLLYRQILYQ